MSDDSLASCRAAEDGTPLLGVAWGDDGHEKGQGVAPDDLLGVDCAAIVLVVVRAELVWDAGHEMGILSVTRRVFMLSRASESEFL